MYEMERDVRAGFYADAMLARDAQIVASWVAGTAIRHATTRPFDLGSAVSEIRTIHGISPQVLAEVAGMYLGSIEGKPTSSWSHPLVAQICFEAGADLSLVPAAMKRARGRSKIVWPGITLPDESVLHAVTAGKDPSCGH
ncbi:hypothetical protein ASH00_06275 [Arthrobacter sp. Soil782]|nr:hypothetical protein ASH00_06275 [Arthrobacter sp. Soil782]